MSKDLYSLIDDDLWPSLRSGPDGPRPVIAHSHARWTSVASREREILSRLARRAPVFVLEPPVHADDVALGRLDLSMPMPNVWRAVPRLPTELIRDEAETLDRIRHFAQQTIGASTPLAERFALPAQWFFTPLPAPRMLGAFGEALVVYDCVDERTWLRIAPRSAAERERLLLSRADVVFASDAAALRVRARAHPNVHVASTAVALADTGAALTREARWTRLVREMEGEVERALKAHPPRPRPLIPSREPSGFAGKPSRSSTPGSEPRPPAS